MIMHHMFIGLGNLPACKRVTNSATGHLDMVPTFVYNMNHAMPKQVYGLASSWMGQLSAKHSF